MINFYNILGVTMYTEVDGSILKGYENLPSPSTCVTDYTGGNANQYWGNTYFVSGEGVYFNVTAYANTVLYLFCIIFIFISIFVILSLFIAFIIERYIWQGDCAQTTACIANNVTN
jgi:hypothetical protein